MNEIFEELRAILSSIWQRRWLAMAVAWGVCILGWLVVALIPNSYESEAKIYVQVEDVLRGTMNTQDDGKKDIVRVRQTLTSSVNLQKVIRSTKLGESVTNQREMEEAIATLTKNVSVKSKEDNLFELKGKVGEPGLSDGENAELAQVVVQKMIDIFREQNIAGNRDEVANSIVFFDKQLDDRKRELEEAEQRRLAFEAANPDLIGGTSTLSQKMQNIQTDLRSVNADLAGAQSALIAISGQISGTPRTIATGATGMGGARAALSQALGQQSALMARGLTPSHPDMVSINRKVELLRRQASQENPNVGGMPNPAYSALISVKAERQANVQALSARKASLQAEIAMLQSSQANEPAVAAEANRINRDYEVLKKKYEELLQKREEMKLRDSVIDQGNSFKFEVTDPPTLPRAPAAPNRPLLLIAVLIVGIGAGVGTAFVTQQLGSTFSTTGKLERALDLPVIGAITVSVTDAARELNAKRKKMFIGASAGLCALCFILLALEIFQRSAVA